MHGSVSAIGSGALPVDRWFGYGRWDAPYWFVGMQPDGCDAAIWCDTWQRLGAPELCDCREHHLSAGVVKWHRSFRPPTQPTWRRLIQLLLGYEGNATDMEAVSFYQRNFWGSRHGRTAIIELGAVRAQAERIEILRQRLGEHKPQFAVFYGLASGDAYARIAGTMFGPDGYAWSGETLCVLVPHPAARNAALDWPRLGQAIRDRVEPRPVCGLRPDVSAAYVQTGAF